MLREAGSCSKPALSQKLSAPHCASTQNLIQAVYHHRLDATWKTFELGRKNLDDFAAKCAGSAEYPVESAVLLTKCKAIAGTNESGPGIDDDSN